MALVITEGFGWATNATDLSTYGPWGGNPWTGFFTGGPLGDNYVSINTPYSSPKFALPGLYSTLYFGTRTNLLSTAQNAHLTFNDTTGNSALNVNWTNTGLITITDANYNTVGNAVSTAITANNWFYLEIYYLRGQPGAVTIRVNGSQVYTSNTIATQTNSGQGIIQSISFSSNADSTGFAHIYVCDNTGSTNNTFLGDVRIQTLLPTANNAVTFAPNGNSVNWQNAAELPINVSDYNLSSTVGATDTFSYQSMSSSLGQIFAVATKVVAAKTDSGIRTMAGVVKSGSSTSTGTAFPPGTTGKQFENIFATDPATSSQWTQSGVNALKAGYTIVT